MCMAMEKECRCGRESARFHHLDSVLPYEVVKNVYCPECSQKIRLNPATMLRDKDWIIEYDMEVASLFAVNMGIPPREVTPEKIFDSGYSSWQGFTPNDLYQANREKIALAELAKTDPAGYLQKIRQWTIDRTRRLQEEGWRKARNTVEV